MGSSGTDDQSGPRSPGAEFLFQRTTDCIVEGNVEDGEPVVHRVNDAFEAVFGFTNSDLRGENLNDFITPEGKRDEVEAIDEEIRDGEIGPREVARQTADGPRDFLLRATGETDSFNYAIYTDITERKERERELQRSRDLLRHAERLSDVGGWELDVETDELRWTEGTYAIYDLPSDSHDPTVEAAFELYHPEDRTTIERAVERCRDTGDPYEVECRLLTAEDRVRWITSNGEAVTEDGTIVALRGAIQDITERKERERTLREERQWRTALFEGSRDAIFITDRDANFVDVNDAATELTGYDRDDLLSMRITDLHEDPDPEAYLESHDRILAGNPATTEAEVLRGDGTVVSVEFSNRRIDIGGEVYVHTVARDVTERNEYEAALERQRDNLTVLNQMVRHDIRNDLQKVFLATDTLKREGHVDEAGHEHVETVLNSARNAVDLTDTARELADVMLQGNTELERTDLALVVREVVDRVRSGEETAVFTIDGEIPEVDVLANDMLDSVFRNLLKNAVQHNDKRVPEVRVTVTESETSVQVRVADNGPGVPDDRKAAIFGKGERRLQSEGTGIGLYLVDTLVDTYDGRLWVEDGDPSGSVFVVELPLADA